MRTIKTLLAVSFAFAVIGPIRADAQHGSESGVDFLGIYATPVFDGGGPPRSEPDVMPFTDEGRRASESYVSERDNPRVLNDCVPETMPRILWTGNPIELRQGEDGTLVIRYERANTVRSVAMDGEPPPADQAHTDLGYSVGRWEGDVLTIDTTHMSGGTITNGDRPLSLEGRVTERYWREPGSMDLQLELEIVDPVNYTESFPMGREFIWAPEEEVRPWVCIDLGPKDEPPDLDELTRMLEEL